MEISTDRGMPFVRFQRPEGEATPLEDKVVAALGEHCLGAAGPVGGSVSTQYTDFGTIEELRQFLKDAGISVE